MENGRDLAGDGRAVNNLPALGHSGRPPQPPLSRTYWVSPSLLAGVYPGSVLGGDARRKVRALCDAGVTLFMDLTDGDDQLESYEHLLVLPTRRSSLGVPDLTVAPVAVVRSALEMIDAESATGGTTYVHCWGGIGRTGSIVGCWLAERTGGAAALDLLIELRSGCADAARVSPETAAQRRLVKGWPQRGGAGA